MDWLEKLIINIWDWSLGFWGDILVQIQDILTTNPAHFGGGAVWDIVTAIYGTVQATGYALLTLFFLIGVFKATATFAEFRRPEVAFKTLIRFVIVKCLVESGMGLLLLFIQIGQGIVSAVFQVSALTGTGMTLPDEIKTAISQAVFLEKFVLFLISFIAIAVIVVMAFTVLLSVFGRFFKIYVYAALSPIPLSAFAGEPTQMIGVSFLKAFGAVCLEGAAIAIACVIYGGFVTVAPNVVEDGTLIVKLLNYIVSVILHTLLLSGLVKGAERLVKELMGL